MNTELNLEVPEITLVEAHKVYPIYPEVQLIKTINPIDILTYVVTNNGYLAPLRLSLPTGHTRMVHIKEITNFALEIDESAKIIKEHFEGWAHFEGKANYIYKDGVVISIFKIKKDE